MSAENIDTARQLYQAFGRGGVQAILDRATESHAERGEDVPVKADDHGLDTLRYGCKTTRQLWMQRIPLALAA